MISKILHSAIENNNGKIVVLSIQKKWLDKIKSGKKTLEIRKSSPWDLQYPFAVMCYETKKEGGCGKSLPRLSAAKSKHCIASRI